MTLQLLSTPLSCLFLSASNQYTACQINVPDLTCSLAAIAVEGKYYSFFRLVQDSDCVLSMIIRLIDSGDRVAVTQKPNGYNIWVNEPEATPRSAKAIRVSDFSEGCANADGNNRVQCPAPSKILKSTDHCKQIQIQVPDLDQPVKAIAHKGKYYSFFRMEPDPERVITILTKTACRGDETIAIKTANGYAICVIEPDAAPL